MYVAKTKALISCAGTAQLICVFVFVYAKKNGFLTTRLISCRLFYFAAMSHVLTPLALLVFAKAWHMRSIKFELLSKISSIIMDP